MPQWSRRDLLRASGVAAVAVPMGVLSTTNASAASAPPAAASANEQQHSRTAMSDEPVMFCVRDARRGEVSILHGTSEVVVHDRDLVARVMNAAHAAPEAR
jgi:hypothetical protein